MTYDVRPVMSRAAQSYAQRGWQVIPLCWPDEVGNCGCQSDHRAAGKAPLVRWKELGEVTPEQVDVWWQTWPEANIGLLLDKSHMLVIDADSAEAVAEVEALGVTGAAIVQSGRGRHYLFACPPEILGRRAVHRGKTREIDILAGGYCILPPSRHSSGRRYSWAVQVEELAPAPAWAVQMLQEAQPSEVDLKLPEVLPTVGIGDLRVSDWWKRVIIQGWLAATEKYSSRSEALFGVIRALLQAGHSPAQVVAVLLNEEWGIGDKLREKSDPLEAARAEVARCIAKGLEERDTSVVRDVLLTGKELLAILKDDTTSYLVDTLFPSGFACVLGGTAKTGKTTLALHLAKAVVTGGTFLGHRASKGPVIFANYEMATKTLAKMYAQIIGTEPDVWPFTVHHPSVPLTRQLLEEYIRQTGSKQPGLVIVDPLFVSLGLQGEEENMAGAVGPPFRALIDLAHETGWSILFLHHLNKAFKGVQGINRLAGSRDIAAAADLLWLWDTHQQSGEPGRLSLIGRAHENKTLRVQLLREACVVLSSDGGDEDDPREDVANAIFDALANGPLPAKDVLETVAAECGVSHSTVQRVRKSMNIETMQIGKKWYWALPEGGAE